MKVLILSRYSELGASSRVRFSQYLPYFESQGIEITVKPFLSDSYVSSLYEDRSLHYEVFKGYFNRFITLFSIRSYDLVVIEKEIFPFMPAIIEYLFNILGVKYIVDYDDALFHNYDLHPTRWVRMLLGKKIDSVMRYASVVTAGNSYIAERALLAGARSVEIIPTVVDANRYQIKRNNTEVPVVGWIGTPQTSKYLQSLLPIFKAIKNDMDVRFVAVGARPEDFEGDVVEAWPWSKEAEVSFIQQFDIGIMPLMDSPWEQGKCGYKLIQYMACGVAVIASPIGVNCKIVEHNKTGKLASSLEEWDSALRYLLDVHPDILIKMGDAGRVRFEEYYSLQIQAPRFLEILLKTGDSIA